MACQKSEHRLSAPLSEFLAVLVFIGLEVNELVCQILPIGIGHIVIISYHPHIWNIYVHETNLISDMCEL